MSSPSNAACKGRIMNQMQGSSSGQSSQGAGSSQRISPGHVASLMAAYMRALIIIVFWTVAGVVTLALGFVACRAVWFGVQKALVALGI